MSADAKTPDDSGSVSSRCYAVAGELLGKLTEFVHEKRPSSSIAMSFNISRDEICFSWSELIGDDLMRWEHRTTFQILSQSRGWFVDNMIQAWTNQVLRKIPSA